MNKFKDEELETMRLLEIYLSCVNKCEDDCYIEDEYVFDNILSFLPKKQEEKIDIRFTHSTKMLFWMVRNMNNTSSW